MRPTPPLSREPSVGTPLTWLYVPGDRPEVVAKALDCGADVVVVDLEDAVAPDRKERALRATAELLSDPAPGTAPVHVRVNALDGPLAETEIRTLAALPGLAGLRLPKVQGPADIHRAAGWATTAAGPAAGRALAGRLATGRRARTPGAAVAPLTTGTARPTRTARAARTAGSATATLTPAAPAPAALPATPALYALLESALGIEHAFAIATAHPALRGIALGEADLATELGVRDEAGLAWPRSRTVVAARAAGLAPPPQSVYPDVADLDGLARSCARGRALGFLGRAAIHPRQLPVIEAAHLPSPEEVEAAAEIVRAAGGEGGAQALPDGRFVDAAVVAGARRVLSLAERRG
ncbi:HpcH/HpaI aldolase/citrate lyase family protein [Streptomyces lydicus]|uniref:Citrate lyase subunit beta n=1 Tax=Streptomyces lydicus TaxID=47763 RepID=A0A1D7VI27_9ACTN|nr:CoA ester lyase [Streptomyces lydicus]AOP46381.1 citrate lyase subunit beta [Streptomyces lydicus]